LRHYATSRKLEVSRPDQVIEFFPIYLILSAALGSEGLSGYNINENQEEKEHISGE
jgi:hypothetical protein